MEHDCNIQHINHWLKHQEDFILNGNLWDNNKVKQELQLQLNDIISDNKGNIMSTNKLHDNKMGYKFQILNRRTNSQDQRLSLHNNHLDDGL